MLPHPVGIVISKKAIIGNKCVIYQGVTIGTIKFSTEKEYPKIRNEVIIYANSIIVGNIEIGNHAIIGANKIINYDVKIGEIITK